MSHFGLHARWWRIAISVYNVIICGRIILRIITEYIACYLIADLCAHASIVSTYVGLERCVKYLIENAKNHSYVGHCLFLWCSSHATHSMVPFRDGLETGIIIFAIAFTIFAVMGVAHFTSGAHFGLPSPMSLLSLNHFAFNQLQLRRRHFGGEWQPCFVRVNHENHLVFLCLSCRVFGCPRSSRPGVSSQRPLAPSTRSTLVSTVTSDFETSSASLDRCFRVGT